MTFAGGLWQRSLRLLPLSFPEFRTAHVRGRALHHMGPRSQTLGRNRHQQYVLGDIITDRCRACRAGLAGRPRNIHPRQDFNVLTGATALAPPFAEKHANPIGAISHSGHDAGSSAFFKESERINQPCSQPCSIIIPLLTSA